MAFRRKHRDPFREAASEEAAKDGDEPWFLGEDDVELDVEAGRSAREEGLS
jgi:hypothetical protein